MLVESRHVKTLMPEGRLACLPGCTTPVVPTRGLYTLVPRVGMFPHSHAWECAHS